MAITSVTAIANSAGTATVTYQHGKAGIQQVISQISVESIPKRLGSQAEVRLNGRYVTSTNAGSNQSASGPPYLVLDSFDTITVTWTGLTSGDQAILTLFLTERLWTSTTSTQEV